MEMHIIIAIISLFLAIWFTIINVFRAMAKQYVSSTNMIIMAIGWTMFISTMWIVP